MHRAALAHVIVFVVGATSAVQIANFTVTGLSVVCLLLAPAFLLVEHRGVELVPLVLAAVGWISYLASGILNDVTLMWPNAIAPASFSLFLIGFTVVAGRAVVSIANLLAGVAAGTVVFFVFHGIELTRTGRFGDLWKYGIAQSATILALFGLVVARAHWAAFPLVLTATGLGSLALNYRSHALVCLLTAAIILVRHLVGSRVGRWWQFLGIAVFGLMFAYVLPVVARTGMFGSALRDKTIEQQKTGLPILLAGRTELPISISAITERPFLGWGSAFELTPDVYTAAEHLAVRMGYPPTFPFELYWRLPVTDYSALHSILLGSWVEGGLFAVLLPIWLLVACGGLVWNCDRYGVWAPLVVVVAVQGIWDLIYSPWTYNAVPVFACITLFFTSVHFLPRAERDAVAR